MLDKKWIEPFGDDNHLKKEYIITSLGKEINKREKKRLNEIIEIASRIMEGTYELGTVDRLLQSK